MFRQVISKFIKVIALCEVEDLNIVDDTLNLIHKKIIELHSQIKYNDNHSSDNPLFPSSNVTQPKGSNKITHLKGQSQKQHKSWIEKQSVAKKIHLTDNHVVKPLRYVI